MGASRGIALSWRPSGVSDSGAATALSPRRESIAERTESGGGGVSRPAKISPTEGARIVCCCPPPSARVRGRCPCMVDMI